MIRFIHLFFIIIFLPTMVIAQKYFDPDGKLKVALVLNPYSGDRAGSELGKGPETMANGGLKEILNKMSVFVQKISTVELTPAEKKEYGRWNRFGMANGHLGKFVAENEKEVLFNIGLLNNCSSLSGMLAGLQHSGEGTGPLRIGLVWIDAHADFNTPETTLSGMLGGMPVAVAAGKCLTRLRLQSGLDPALPEKYIVMVCVRDTDPLEQELLDNSYIEMISVEDIRKISDNVHQQMERLSKLTDKIYIHIDLDVLDPAEVSGHPLTVPNGPSSKELALVLEEIFKYEKTSAIGIASLPSEDKDNLSLKAAYTLIEGAITGIKGR